MPISDFVNESKVFCREHQYIFKVLSSGERTYFAIRTNLSVLMGFFTTPEIDRIWDDRAWNRIINGINMNLRTLHGTNQEGLPVKCLVVQVWEQENDAIIIPLDTLNQTETFRESGNFNIIKDNQGYYLRTPRGEENIRLEVGIDKILGYL